MVINYWQYKVVVTSSDINDIDAPWEWCVQNLVNDTWKFELNDGNTFEVAYFFKNKEDAVKFKLTWG